MSWPLWGLTWASFIPSCPSALPICHSGSQANSGAGVCGEDRLAGPARGALSLEEEGGMQHGVGKEPGHEHRLRAMQGPRHAAAGCCGDTKRPFTVSQGSGDSQGNPSAAWGEGKPVLRRQLHAVWHGTSGCGETQATSPSRTLTQNLQPRPLPT